MSKPTVAFYIPHNGTVSMEFVAKTLMPLFFADSVDVCNKMLISAPVWSVTVNRNMLVQRALENGADYVFFLDSDMIFDKIAPIQAIKALLDMDVPIASGLCRTKLNGFPLSAFRRVEGKNTTQAITDISEKIIRVDAVGMACCLIKRSVFEAMRKPYFVWNDEGDSTEDGYFCNQAYDRGIPIYVNTQVSLGHLGAFVLGIDNTLRSSNNSIFLQINYNEPIKEATA